MKISPDTNITGIFQSDLIIQSAIEESIRRLRNNPSEIDYIFQSLVKDKLTADQYGQAGIDAFKHWFLNQDIPVSPAFRVDELKLPIITFSLISSDEAEQTLGDIHYVPQEDTEGDWPVIAGPFNPVSYIPSSGIMEIPDNIDEFIAPGMYLVDKNGVAYEIIDCFEDLNEIALTPGTIADFRGVVLKSNRRKLVTTIESVFMRESYQIGVHVKGEAWYLVALHSILNYLLQKYKEELLEAREFERTVITNTEFRRNSDPDFGQEIVFSRWLNITGYVKNIWAKRVKKAIDEVNVQAVISNLETGIVISGVDDGNNNPPVNEAGWPAGPDDPFTVRPQ